MAVEFTPYSNIPAPDEDAQDDVPYYLTQLVDAIDPALVLFADSSGDRDARFLSCPMGVVCVVTDGTSVFGVYVKTSAPGTASWGTIWSPPAAINWTDLSLATDITKLATKPQISVEDNNLWANLTGDLQTISTATLVNGQTVATVPSQFHIVKTIRHPVAMNQVPGSWGAGYVVVDAGTGAVNTWGITASAQPQWIDLSGVRFQCSL